MKEEMINESRDGIKEGSVLVPFLVGGIVGAGIALLLAPKSGKELRGDIKELATVAKNGINSAMDKTVNLYDEGKAAVKNAIDAGKTAYVEERDRHRQAA